METLKQRYESEIAQISSLTKGEIISLFLSVGMGVYLVLTYPILLLGWGLFMGAFLLFQKHLDENDFLDQYLLKDLSKYHASTAILTYFCLVSIDPFYLSVISVILVIVVWVIQANYGYRGGLVKRKDRNKREGFLMLFLLLNLLFIGLEHFGTKSFYAGYRNWQHSESYNPYPDSMGASFNTDLKERELEFQLKPIHEHEEWYEQYRGKEYYRDIIFIGIKTDNVDDTLVSNHNQANLHIDIEMPSTWQSEDRPFWRTHIRANLIEVGIRVENVINGEASFTDWSMQYKILSMVSHSSIQIAETGINSLTLDADYIRMAEYILMLDFTIFRDEINSDLYNTDSLDSLETYFNYQIEGDLNFGIHADTQGYIWFRDSFTYREPPTFFDKFVGEETWAIISISAVIFLIATLLALITRKTKAMKHSLLMIRYLFLITMFGVVANAMQNPPSWLVTALGGTAEASYIWAAVEMARYLVISILVWAIFEGISGLIQQSTAVISFASNSQDVELNF